MNYFIVDDCTKSKGTFEYEYAGMNCEKALAKFRAEWEKLSEHDRKIRDHFRLSEGEIDENGGLFENYTEFSFK